MGFLHKERVVLGLRVVSQKKATHPKAQNLKRRISLTIGGKIALTSTFTTMGKATSGSSSTRSMTVRHWSMTVRNKYRHGLRHGKTSTMNSTPPTTTTYHDAMTQNPQTFRFPLQLRHKE